MTPETTPEEKTPQERLAERAAADPFYMASALSAYRQAEGLDAPALADFLGCAPADLPRLALCRKPGAVGESEFSADVAHLTERFGLRRLPLIRLLRQEAFLQAASASPSASFRTESSRPPLLLAAQDREGDAEDQETEESR